VNQQASAAEQRPGAPATRVTASRRPRAPRTS
jgi:hypothetical protein